MNWIVELIILDTHSCIQVWVSLGHLLGLWNVLHQGQPSLLDPVDDHHWQPLSLCTVLLLFLCFFWPLLLVLGSTWTFDLHFEPILEFSLLDLWPLSSVLIPPVAHFALLDTLTHHEPANTEAGTAADFLSACTAIQNVGSGLLKWLFTYESNILTHWRWATSPVLAFPRWLNWCLLCCRFIEENVLWIFQVALRIQSSVVRVNVVGGHGCVVKQSKKNSRPLKSSNLVFGSN